MAVVATDPCKYALTATGTLGEKRETMLGNQLLLKCELGKPMKRGYSEFPGMNYCYGKPNAIKDGGAADALSGWPGSGGLYFHRKKENASNNIQPERDFMALNKSAILSGLTTAPEHYQFRATHDIRRRVQTEGDKKKTSRRIPPTMVYGIATRPSTPIHDLLEHKYQDRWLEERRSMELSRRQKDESKKLTPGKVYDTRASILRTHQVPVEGTPLWQLPKFTKKAAPSLETFRTERAKDLAFKSYQSDGISRRGVFGQGVYEQ